ncbi:MAG: hypothetical protein ACRD00_00335 [Thermoanaerobaculia bacterium]
MNIDADVASPGADASSDRRRHRAGPAAQVKHEIARPREPEAVEPGLGVGDGPVIVRDGPGMAAQRQRRQVPAFEGCAAQPVEGLEQQ